MKKTLLTLMLAATGLTAMAQHTNHKPGGQQPPATRYTATFESAHGEAFTVFIDGDQMNRMPQSRVIVNDVSDQTHEVVVVLKRPAEKAAVLSLRPGEANVTVNVNYDSRAESLYLYTPMHNRGDVADDMQGGDRRGRGDRRGGNRGGNSNSNANSQSMQNTIVINTGGNGGGHTPPPPEQVGVGPDELDAMVIRMKNQSFDSDRLALGKTIVAASPLTAAQIARLAETLDFSKSQVEFLKYAYNYCIDKPNYYKTTDILTFSSDKKKVLDYIATQH